MAEMHKYLSSRYSVTVSIQQQFLNTNYAIRTKTSYNSILYYSITVCTVDNLIMRLFLNHNMNA